MRLKKDMTENNCKCCDRSEQVERITHYEEIFDRITQVLSALKKSVNDYKAVKEEIDALSAYYASDEWKKDFSDDEKGKLPKDLKRGVLSEDGIYLLLEEIKETADCLKNEEDT